MHIGATSDFSKPQRAQSTTDRAKTLQSVIEKNIFEEVNFQFVEIYRTKTQMGHNFHSSPTPGSKYLNRLKATNSSTSYPKKLE